MKQLMLMMMFLIASFVSIAQATKDKDGYYVSADKAKEPASPTGEKYKDSKGKIYDIYKNSKGKWFINKISAKSGKTYRDYSPFAVKVIK